MGQDAAISTTISFHKWLVTGLQIFALYSPGYSSGCLLLVLWLSSYLPGAYAGIISQHFVGSGWTLALCLPFSFAISASLVKFPLSNTEAGQLAGQWES